MLPQHPSSSPLTLHAVPQCHPTAALHGDAHRVDRLGADLVRVPPLAVLPVSAYIAARHCAASLVTRPQCRLQSLAWRPPACLNDTQMCNISICRVRGRVPTTLQVYRSTVGQNKTTAILLQIQPFHSSNVLVVLTLSTASLFAATQAVWSPDFAQYCRCRDNRTAPYTARARSAGCASPAPLPARQRSSAPTTPADR